MRQSLQNIKSQLTITLCEIESPALTGCKVDMSEAERLCEMIERKDKEVVLKMLKGRDFAKKDWLKNFLSGELSIMLETDKYDLESHIQS